jgi:hypothetical protein
MTRLLNKRLYTRSAAGIGFTCYRISDTSLTLLVRTDSVYEIITVSSELIGTVITHPGAACSGGDGKLNTLVLNGTDTVIRVGENKGNQSEKVGELHLYICRETFI